MRTCTHCGDNIDVWPSRDCEEPLEHAEATRICDCGEELHVTDSNLSSHRRCHLIP
jgi:hypothetical protein